jgi:hypothetical protein
MMKDNILWSIILESATEGGRGKYYTGGGCVPTLERLQDSHINRLQVIQKDWNSI